MSERFFRLILGISLVLFLLFREERAIYVYIGVMLFEGITNLRIPMLVSRLRYGPGYEAILATPPCAGAKVNFDSERAQRFVVAGVLIIGYTLFREALWFLPWILGFALILASISGFCPVARFFRLIGFK
jgi:hypothetical protein